ncbi:MAG: hypothetical protein QOH10_2403 [Actinomycetota bacterium]|jgi:hypothetical protein|nr:hypothetical protein [Actinomycetota bacterium]
MSVPALNLVLIALVVASVLGIVTVGSILDRPHYPRDRRPRIDHEANPSSGLDDLFPGSPVGYEVGGVGFEAREIEVTADVT